MSATKSTSPPRLSVVIPTCGRSSLADTLESIVRQEWIEGDEVVVVADGSHEQAREDFLDSGLPGRFLTHGPTRNFGNAQREFAYRVCHGDFIVHMDDDDIFAEEAFVKIRKAVATAPSCAHLFRVVAPWGEVVWTDPGVIEQGNVCTIQLVVPNVREALPKWPRRQGGNIGFTRDCRETFGLMWRPEIIAICRPQGVWW